MHQTKPHLFSLRSYTLFLQPFMCLSASEFCSRDLRRFLREVSRDKSWRLLGLLPFCAVSFTIGYGLRVYSAFDAYIYSPSNATNLIVFIMSQVFIFICPPLLELVNYNILGRLLAYVPHLSPLRPQFVFQIFGSIMLVIETLNSLGVSLSANPSSGKSVQDLGKGITLTALVMQILIICSFGVLALIFHRRVARSPLQVRTVLKTLWTLYGSMTLIFVRCIYRLVEHLGNTHIDLDDPAALARLSPVLRYEAYFYVFEASLMLINILLWSLLNPGELLARDVYLCSDGVTEIAYVVVEKRKWWLRWVPGGRHMIVHQGEEEVELARGASS